MKGWTFQTGYIQDFCVPVFFLHSFYMNTWIGSVDLVGTICGVLVVERVLSRNEKQQDPDGKMTAFVKLRNKYKN